MNEYTIISAEYANEEQNAILLQTKEFGAVMISEKDRPELWKQANNTKIKKYIVPIVPTVVNKSLPKQAGPNVLA
jgi:hypothetical protein